MQNHPVFHVSKSQAFVEPRIKGQSVKPLPPIEVELELKWEVKAILDSKLDPRTKTLTYRIEWLGYEGTPEQVTWEPALNLENTPEMVRKFHEENPSKPRKPQT